MTTKTAARLIGFFFLAAIIAYGGGNALLTGQTDITAQAVAGALLMACNSAFVICVGLLARKILKNESPQVATGYLTARTIEAALLLIGVIYLVLGKAGAIPTELATMGNNYAYQLAMTVLGIGSVPFLYALRQAKLIPPFLAGWGMVGYTIFLAGAILELFGLKVGLMLSAPGGLFELFFGFWLIVKGFSSTTSKISYESHP